MKYLLVLLCCLLAIGKVTIQSAFSKKHIRTFPDAVFFMALVFTFSGIFFSSDVIGCSPVTWIYGALFGLCSMVFQLSYTKALSMGNVSVTVMISNLGMLFSVILSATVFHEPLSPLRLLGILMTVATLVISVDFKRGNKAEKSWLFFALTTLFATGLANCIQKFFSATEAAGEAKAFVACAYLVAAVATFLWYFSLHLGHKRKTYETKPRVFLYALGVGVLLAVFQLAFQYSITQVDGTFLFPAYSGGCIILSSLTGVLLFRDKLTRKQIISLATGCIAVVLMNF